MQQNNFRHTTFTVLLLLCFNATVLAQRQPQQDASPQAMHDIYMAQANKKRLVGWTMIAGGTVLTVGGIAKMMSPAFEGQSKTSPGLLWMPAAGILSTLGGIPMVMSGKKLEKKADMILQGERVFISPHTRWQLHYPAIAIRIRL